MLWDSVRKNSEHNVRVILEANFPVDAPLNPLGMTALHFACSHSTKEVINTILSFHPNVNSRDYVSAHSQSTYHIFINIVFIHKMSIKVFMERY